VNFAKFFAAQDGKQYIGPAVVQSVHYPEPWLKSHEPKWDFAVAELDVPLGKTLGYMEVSALDTAALLAQPVTLAGYPRKRGGTLWAQSGYLDQPDKELLYYSLYTEEGQSGSGIWARQSSRYIVVGVHTTGSPEKNWGVRITTTKLDVIQGWIDAK